MSKAVNICRRILQAVADKLFPPTEDMDVSVKENYINRLIVSIENHKEN